MTRTEVIALVTLATAAYPSAQGKDPAPITNAWGMMLTDVPYGIATAAVIRVCRSSKFFPSVAEIVEAAQELDPRYEKLPTAAEAWEEVSRLIRNAGPNRLPVYSCDTVRRAVRAIGMAQLCWSENQEANRAHFLRIYESMRAKHREHGENEKALQLSGMSELVKALCAKN
jgi:hypothetical protein